MIVFLNGAFGIGKTSVARQLRRQIAGSAIFDPELVRADGYREAVLWTLTRYPQAAAFYAAMGWSASEITRNEGRQVLYTHPLCP